MSPSNRKIIKIRPRIAMAMVAFVLIAFAATVFISNKQASKDVKASFENKIERIMITGNEDYGGLRAAVFYKKNHFISTSAVLIENKLNFKGWQSDGPIIDFNSEPHTYRLSDLGLPYILSKNANSDTLYVEKDGFPLKFLMTDE